MIWQMLIIIKIGGGIFPSVSAVRVNLRTTFPVHKSSFCVRILLPLLAEWLVAAAARSSSVQCMLSLSALLLLLIRFMGDKSVLERQSRCFCIEFHKRMYVVGREGSLLFLSIFFQVVPRVFFLSTLQSPLQPL